jgi:hypothetical protein
MASSPAEAIGGGSDASSAAANPKNVLIGGKKGLASALPEWFAKNKKTVIIGVVVGLLYAVLVRYIKAKGKDSDNPSGENPNKNKILQMAENLKNKNK